MSWFPPQTVRTWGRCGFARTDHIPDTESGSWREVCLRAQAGRRSTSTVRHRDHYVVSGTVRFTSAAEHIDVTTGGMLTAPIGVPHTFSNPDPEVSATFMCTIPPTFISPTSVTPLR